jgi:hypothetical protein
MTQRALVAEDRFKGAFQVVECAIQFVLQLRDGEGDLTDGSEAFLQAR